MKQYTVAVVGATGLVGTMLIHLLQERHFPIKKINLVASQQSIGKKLLFQSQAYELQNLADFDFSGVDLAFFCVAQGLAAEYIPRAVAAGSRVIDKSACFRNHPDVPLLVPEVNMHALMQHSQSKIIASPNCNTIPIAVGLKPIYDAVGIARVNIATYQSVSGTGKEGVTELMEQTRHWLDKQPIQSKIYPQQIAFNVLPHIDEFEENGYTVEEMKMVHELRKIFNQTNLAINPTAVRVPVQCGHAAAVHIETQEKITAKQAEMLLTGAKGIKVISGKFPYPTPVQDAEGKDEVYIGRIREDLSCERGLNLWIVADNLRKGAALNAIQIAEHLIEVT